MSVHSTNYLAACNVSAFYKLPRCVPLAILRGQVLLSPPC